MERHRGAIVESDIHLFRIGRMTFRLGPSLGRRLGRSWGRLLTSAQASPAFDAKLVHQREDLPPSMANGYTIQVFTGDRRGASTNANVHATLIGDAAESGPHALLGDFGRATMQCFFVQTSEDIGTLRQLRIGHDATDIGSGWFVDKVVVERLDTGEQLEFLCHRWLGESDSGGIAGPPVQVLDHVSGPDAVDEELEPDRALWPLKLVTAGAAMPRTDKIRHGQKARVSASLGWGGEDAFFVTQGVAAGSAVWTLGVTDGVGSWRDACGIDAGEYSRQLAMAALAAEEAAPKAGHSVLDVVREAYDAVCRRGTKGSTTICVARFETRSGHLHTANIGDSGCLVVREGRVVHRSPQQEHTFGCPYQLGHHESASTPDDAQLDRVRLEADDVVVLGTDGLFDNLADSEIAAVAAELTAVPVRAHGHAGPLPRSRHGLRSCRGSPLCCLSLPCRAVPWRAGDDTTRQGRTGAGQPPGGARPCRVVGRRPRYALRESGERHRAQALT